MNIWEMSRDGLVFLLKYVYRYGFFLSFTEKEMGFAVSQLKGKVLKTLSDILFSNTCAT